MSPDQSEAPNQAIDNAWKIHSANLDWTGRVDTKASFVLTIESALALATLTLSGGGRRLAQLNHFIAQFSYWTGVIVLAVALILILQVVKPRLRSRRLRDEWRTNFVYFGHAKYWDATELTDALKNQDLLPMLAQQIKVTAQIAWTKHILLKWSINSAMASVSLLVVAAVLK